MMQKYLKESEIVDISHEQIRSLAKKLSTSCKSDEEIAKACFLYVRDEIHHSGDYKDDIVTLKASEVLQHKTGWCYAKAILLAALLRANDIPTAFCYQHLSCGEYEDGIYCLHGLNAVYLKEHGWYKIDARGNKEGVDAQFHPPVEQLAFVPQGDEYDIDTLYIDPIPEIVEALQRNRSYQEMVDNFPTLKS